MFSNILRNWIAIIKVYLYCKGIWWKPKMLTWTSFCSFFTAPAGCVPNNYLPLVLEPLHGFKKVIELKARIFEQLCWSLTYIHFQTSNDLFSNDNSGFYDYIIRWNSFEFLLPNFDRFFVIHRPVLGSEKKIYSGKLEGVFSAEIKVLECVKCWVKQVITMRSAKCLCW